MESQDFKEMFGMLGAIWTGVVAAVFWLGKWLFSKKDNISQFAAKLYDLKSYAKLAEQEEKIRSLESQLAASIGFADRLCQTPPATRGEIAGLHEKLKKTIEDIAVQFEADGASLYVPVYSKNSAKLSPPLGFAYAAIYNRNKAVEAQLNDQVMVGLWSLIGLCWRQKKEGPIPNVNTSPWHPPRAEGHDISKALSILINEPRHPECQIGMLHLFKMNVGGVENITGFDENDTESVRRMVNGDNSLEGTLDEFLGTPGWEHMLRVDDRIIEENVVILFADLTGSSSLFEKGENGGAKMINKFNQFLYEYVQGYNAVVERFIGDGVMMRFHHIENPEKAEDNPVFRAVSAAATLVSEFEKFSRDNGINPQSGKPRVYLRLAITLGPIVEMTVGPRQLAMQTVLGTCVNRAAKMVAHADRARNIVVLDDTAHIALCQFNDKYDDSLKEYSFGACGDIASLSKIERSVAGKKTAKLLKIDYRELVVEKFIESAQYKSVQYNSGRRSQSDKYSW